MTAPRLVNAMSVDVEDYFQVSAFDAVVPREAWDRFEPRVERNTDHLLGLFSNSGVKATFFVLGWIAERQRGLVKRIVDAGHEIASHGFGHRLIYEQTPEEFRQDVRRAKATLEDASGHEVHGYRAPSFSVTKSSLWALDVLIEEGHRYDASIFPIHHDRYGIPGAPRHPHVLRRAGGTLVEVPPSTVRVGPLNLPIAGGGYFRLLPYRWTTWGIRRVNQVEGRPVIFYLHPWEVDPDQPQLPGSVLSRFRHYHRLRETEPRLRRLLSEFRFDSIAKTLLQKFIVPQTAES